MGLAPGVNVFRLFSSSLLVGTKWRHSLFDHMKLFWHYFNDPFNKLDCFTAMEQHDFKNVNNHLNTNICSYLETSGDQSSNLYLNIVHFFNTSVS